MNIQELRNNLRKKQDGLKVLEKQANEQKVLAKAAKANAADAKAQFKHLRKEAKRAKRLLAELQCQVQDQLRAVGKAEKRLAKALRESPGTMKREPVKPAAAAPAHQPVRKVAAHVPAVAGTPNGTGEPLPKPQKSGLRSSAPGAAGL